jgi:hypothetical protein
MMSLSGFRRQPSVILNIGLLLEYVSPSRENYTSFVPVSNFSENTEYTPLPRHGGAPSEWIDEFDESERRSISIDRTDSVPCVNCAPALSSQNIVASRNPIAQGHYIMNGIPNLSYEPYFRSMTAKNRGEDLYWSTFGLARIIMNFNGRFHDNPCLSAARKNLSYLQMFLGEELKSRLFGLLWDRKSYGTVLAELKRLYGNSARIVEAYIHKVKTFAPVKTNADIGSFCTQVT